MKVYISADIEGVAGIAAASEANRDAPGDYAPFRRQMEAEVAAACHGAFAAGASEVVVKDAHGTGRNLTLDDVVVPSAKRLHLIRGWSGHPLGMVQDIDESFTNALFIGFHCGAGQAGNPLAHTINGRLFAKVELNGAIASELRLYALAAASVHVPVVFLSGDHAVCKEAEDLIPGVATLSTLEGIGPSVRSLTPSEAVRRIREESEAALEARKARPMAMPGTFRLAITFNHAADAYARSFYPGAVRLSDHALELASDDYLAVLTFLRFASRYQ